ncbi:hypothetical protein J437_LFUL015755 [Ladona fulva]|uniref:Phosphoribulokinase/uridine kinase domain-containing protein n=1 Tax=Ladona fulva TaxID=123851 RepID=A0A8K0PAI1_LADFU|nr:hypothetical protein J437_LFUL015755 [Ladona fulva]
MASWLIIGISGVTCGGKTSLAVQLKSLLTKYFLSQKCVVAISTISQDDYFLKADDPRHVYLPSLDHNNWELPTAVDLDAMYKTSQDIISVKNDETQPEGKHDFKKKLLGILLIEGFLVLNHKPTRSLCHMSYYLVLSRAICLSRRLCRSYDPPDVPGYFEDCVWPEHVYRRAEIFGKGKLVDYSDPLCMNELSQCLQIADSIISTNKNPEQHDPSRESSLETVVTQKEKLGVKTDSDLFMRIGGNVLPLEGFGKAGLGIVDGIRILNGGVIGKEELAELVFKDVLHEIERLNFG